MADNSAFLRLVGAIRNMVSFSPSRSSIECDHANEVPHVCRCPADCYCRVHGSCMERPVIDRHMPRPPGRVVVPSLEDARADPEPPCPLCENTGILSHPSGEGPCPCPKGDEAVFITAWADGAMTGARMKAIFALPSPSEFRALAQVVSRYATEHGEDLIGALMLTGGGRVLSESGLVALARRLEEALKP